MQNLVKNGKESGEKDHVNVRLVLMVCSRCNQKSLIYMDCAECKLVFCDWCAIEHFENIHQISIHDTFVKEIFEEK